jgi:hypothetical protein
VSATNSNLAKTKTLLLSMVAEAKDLKQAAGGCVTDAVAGWLAPQYMLAVSEKLAGSEGAQRLEILRVFAQDWAVLRHGDHTAERLRIERERLKVTRRDIECKWRADEQKALEFVLDEMKQFPEVKKMFIAAFDAFKESKKNK